MTTATSQTMISSQIIRDDCLPTAVGRISYNRRDKINTHHHFDYSVIGAENKVDNNNDENNENQHVDEFYQIPTLPSFPPSQSRRSCDGLTIYYLDFDVRYRLSLVAGDKDGEKNSMEFLAKRLGRARRQLLTSILLYHHSSRPSLGYDRTLVGTRVSNGKFVVGCTHCTIKKHI